MKLAYMFLLALPFVTFSFPLPEEGTGVTTVNEATEATSEATAAKGVSAATGSEPVEAQSLEAEEVPRVTDPAAIKEERVVYRHGDKVYATKEALIQAVKAKNVVQHLPGQSEDSDAYDEENLDYSAYETTAYDHTVYEAALASEATGNPATRQQIDQAQSAPKVVEQTAQQPAQGKTYTITYPPGYDYYTYPHAAHQAAFYPNQYPPVDPYAATLPYAYDYSAYYAEQAAYDAALKEYEYKKYLYDTNQQHLRPDLFPEYDRQSHSIGVGKSASVTQPKAGKASPGPQYHQQVSEQYDHARPQSNPVAPQQTYQRQASHGPKEQAEYQAARNIEFPEHAQSQQQQVKQAEKEYQRSIPAESAYYPEYAHHNPAPFRAARIESDVHCEVDPRVQAQGQQPTEVQPLYKIDDAPQQHHQHHQQPHYPQQAQYYQQPHPQQSHPQQQQNIGQQHQQPQQQQQQQQHQPTQPAHSTSIACPPANHYTNKPASCTNIQTSNPSQQHPSRKSQPVEYRASNQISPDSTQYEIFNRDTLGRRLLNKHGYLDDAGAEWVVAPAAAGQSKPY